MKKPIRWNEEKNQLLQLQRGVGFEIVIEKLILDTDEVALLNEIESGAWQDDQLGEAEMNSYKESAAYTLLLQEKKRASILLTIGDLAKLKAISRDAGIGYQSIIQSLVHNYVAGKNRLEI